MAPEECISALGGWEGYELCGWRQERRGEGSWCVLRLRRVLARSAGIARHAVAHRAGFADVRARRGTSDPTGPSGVPALRAEARAARVARSVRAGDEAAGRERLAAVRGDVDPARGRLLRAELEDGQEHRQTLARAAIGSGGPQGGHGDRDGRVRDPARAPLRHGGHRACSQTSPVGRARTLSRGGLIPLVPGAAAGEVLTLEHQPVPVVLDEPHERDLTLQALELGIRDARHGYAPQSASRRAHGLPAGSTTLSTRRPRSTRTAVPTAKPARSSQRPVRRRCGFEANRDQVHSLTRERESTGSEPPRVSRRAPGLGQAAMARPDC